MKLYIDKKGYELRYTVRAMMMFEQVKGSMFSLNTLTDQYLFLYCTILANNKDTDLTFDKLLTYIDEDPTIFSNFANFIKTETDRQAELKGKDSDTGGESGKN